MNLDIQGYLLYSKDQQKRPMLSIVTHIYHYPPSPSSTHHAFSRRSIHPPTLPLPISRLESRIVRRHKICARPRTLILLTVHTSRTSPRAAEIDIGDNRLIPEMAADIAVRVREVGQRRGPGAWVWCRGI